MIDVAKEISDCEIISFEELSSGESIALKEQAKPLPNEFVVQMKKQWARIKNAKEKPWRSLTSKGLECGIGIFGMNKLQKS